MESVFGVPLYGDINIGGSHSGSNLIIREANKVIVEQNEKLAETAQGIKNSVVGIYKKIGSAEKKQAGSLLLGDYYRLEKFAGQAFIITSDGWLTTMFLSDDIKTLIGKNYDAAKLGQEIAKNYVVISSDRKIYQIDRAVYDKESGYLFWHIPAIDLPVKKFTLKTDLINGQSVFAFDFKGLVWPTVILGIIDKNSEIVKSSDSCQNEILLAQAPAGDMAGALLFDYNGGLIGILNNSNKIAPLYNYLAVVSSLLKTKSLTRPMLGLNYINLSDLARTDNSYKIGALITKDKNGVAIVKNSPAEKAGLKENDIILSINSVEISADNELYDVIQQFKGGDEINVGYLRGKDKQAVKLTLADK
jgi:S1-C subfamily serine protease